MSKTETLLEYFYLFRAAQAMRDALAAVSQTYRTFRNVPKEDQEWTALDDEALEAVEAALAKAEGR
jgi:hypothetical protein